MAETCIFIAAGSGVSSSPPLFTSANSPAPPRMLLLPLQDVLGFSQTGGKQLEVGRYC